SADQQPLFLDLFDMTNVGSGKVRTPAICPPSWENLTDHQLDRFAAITLAADLLKPFETDSRLLDVFAVLRSELGRTAIETLEPAMRALRQAQEQRDNTQKVISLRFPNATTGALKSDNGVLYLRTRRLPDALIEYTVSGLDQEITFE